ncbi:MAG: hypothetical protein JNL57_08625 [Bacteroidetes bacterium]|nr:hypothetical protein [Bacteroidota bacterium]
MIGKQMGRGIVVAFLLCMGLNISGCNTKCTDHPGYHVQVPVKLATWNDTFHVGDTIHLFFNFNAHNMPVLNTNEIIGIDVEKFDIDPLLTVFNILDSTQYGLGLNDFKMISNIHFGVEKSSTSSFIKIYSFNYQTDFSVADTFHLVCNKKGAFILSSVLWKCSARSTPGAKCKRRGWWCTMAWDKADYVFDPNHYLDKAQSERRKFILNGESSGYDIRYAFIVK